MCENPIDLTMASNFIEGEDDREPNVNQDITQASVQDLLDGTSINIDEVMPTVPVDLSTNPFINPVMNQTLNEITGRDLGALGLLRVNDADTVIHKLTDDLHTAVSKNNNSSALLTKLDEHHKRLEEQMVQLENGKEQLRKENEATKLNKLKILKSLEEAKQEKTDHTINQERLGENI